MSQEICPQLKLKLEELKSLKSELDLELENAKKEKNTEKALEIQEEIKNIISEIRKELSPKEISAEYIHPDGRKETITLSFEKKFQEYI